MKANRIHLKAIYQNLKNHERASAGIPSSSRLDVAKTTQIFHIFFSLFGSPLPWCCCVENIFHAAFVMQSMSNAKNVQHHQNAALRHPLTYIRTNLPKTQVGVTYRWYCHLHKVTATRFLAGIWERSRRQGLGGGWWPRQTWQWMKDDRASLEMKPKKKIYNTKHKVCVGERVRTTRRRNISYSQIWEDGVKSTIRENLWWIQSFQKENHFYMFELK